ncbi:MAG: pantetheine-phosphate adenylyltransferase [Verrucomicrobia bacterium]|nr:pantetheine-phosphate adenylyltransferase [Verrucomicrobiota bacterium]
MNSTAIYAGTFDPITLGHLDVMERASLIFGKLILAVAESVRKKPLFTLEERVGLAEEASAPFENIEVDSFNGLLVEYARAKKAHVLIRGLRAFSDFEFEFQMALTNRKLAPEIETMFLMPKEEYSYVSSNTVKEIAALGGSFGQFVPLCVGKALKDKLVQSRQ